MVEEINFDMIHRWIAITTVMKTSSRVKVLPKPFRDQLFMSLKTTYAPEITDDQVKQIEEFIDNLSKDIQKSLMRSASKFLGKDDIKEAIKKVKGLFGKEDADTITKLFGQRK